MVSAQRPEAPQIVVVNLSPQHVEALEAMQRVVFYTLTPEELFTAAHYHHHLEVFPEGQFVALAQVDGKPIPVGATVTFRTSWKFANTSHTFLEAIDGGWLGNHNPKGEWLYGADVSVLPEYRGFGIGRKLYNARAQLVKRLNLRGEVAGGMIPGYENYRAKMSLEEYVRRVAKSDIFDPTLSMQMRNGFVPHHIIYNHITDPRADDCAVLIVRKNPDYQEPKHTHKR
jgi:GNAT superfamily N-acetyltransferase